MIRFALDNGQSIHSSINGLQGKQNYNIKNIIIKLTI